MAGPVINFTEEGRCILAKFVGISHWLCILPSFICLLTALYLQIQIQDKISFIESYDGLVLPGFLVFSGFFGFFAHIICGKVAYTNRIPEKREKWSGFMLAAIIATAVLFLSELVSGILCFVHVTDLEESLENGIKVAMSAYKNDATTKEETDILQMTYECCGSRSYKDWFYLTWIHPDYSNLSRARGQGHMELGPNLIVDDVPFSCCNPHVLRPCISNHVHDNDMHYNYDFRTRTTLYTVGCTDKLMAFYENSVLVVAGSLVLGLSFLQLILVFTFRLLQTAVATAMASDDQEGPSVGYLLSNPDPFGGMNSTMPSEQDTLLDTTGETVDQDEERYSRIYRGGSEPMYETPVTADNEEPIYHEGEVEEYLATKFANSRERIAHFADPEYKEVDEFPLPEDEPIYQNVNQSRNIPSFTRVDSNYGSYMKMDLSNSSSPRKNMKRDHLYRRKPRKIAYSPVFRHPLPSPSRMRNKHHDTFVINMAAQNSPEASKPFLEVRNFAQPQRVCKLHPATPRPQFPKPRPPKRRPPTAHKSYWSPAVSPKKLQTIIDNHMVYQMSPRSPGKRHSSAKRYSPMRYISPPRTTFKPGVSYDCNHALY